MDERRTEYVIMQKDTVGNWVVGICEARDDAEELAAEIKVAVGYPTWVIDVKVTPARVRA